MVFSTPAFLFLFLPLFLGVYLLVPARARLAWILLASWAFYGFWRLDFLALMIAVSAVNWGAGWLVDRSRRAGKTALSRLAIAACIVADLGVLGYFKYFNFGVDTLNAGLALAGISPIAAWSVVLPVGISFYVFQAMSYAIDVYRDDAPAAKNPVDMFAYLALFPQLVAGPIIRYKDLADQLRSPRLDGPGLAYGARRFFTGFCRKVLVADTVAPLADAAFSLAAPSAPDAWLGALAYAVQLYFDFAAYSDMAIGLGHMMGFSFMENFDTPYRAASITDFWRRWHISLSTWLRDYLYIPLGGNRLGGARTYLNLALVMAIGGLWHGASWNFVLWGCWHGFLLAFERATRKLGAALPVTAPRWLAAQLAVLAGWVLFRAVDLPAAGRMFAGMAGLNGFSPGADFAWRAGGLELAALVLGLAVTVLEPRVAAYRGPFRESGSVAPGARGARLAPALSVLGLGALSVAAILKLAAAGYSPFLYFQF